MASLEVAFREFKGELIQKNINLQGKLILCFGNQHENGIIYLPSNGASILVMESGNTEKANTINTLRESILDCLITLSREEMLDIFLEILYLPGKDPSKMCDNKVLSNSLISSTSNMSAIGKQTLDTGIEGRYLVCEPGNEPSEKYQPQLATEEEYYDTAYRNSGSMFNTFIKDKPNENLTGYDTNREEPFQQNSSSLYTFGHLSQVIEKRYGLRNKNVTDDKLASLPTPEKSSEKEECENLQRTKSCHISEVANRQKLFMCNVCGESFPSRSQYKRHFKQHVNPHKCDICDKVFKSKDSLYHHQRGIHSKEKPYHCHVCGKSFGFHHSFTLHMRRHKGERPYKCDLCPKSYLASNHLKEHIQASHSDKSIICHVCGKKFSYVNTLKVHLEIHEGENHSCSVCFKTFNSKHALNRHAASHSNKSFQCIVCRKYFKTENALKLHSKLHNRTQEKRFSCDVCGKSFMYKCILERHAQSHNEFRTYVCIICSKVFKNKASLYSHQYVHSEGKPHTCSTCGKSFKTKSCFVAHSKRHEIRCTFMCTLCDKTFQDKGGLSKHMKTVHRPQNYYSCKICDKTSTRADNLRTHVKSHRKEVGPSDNPADFILVHENQPSTM